MKPAGIGLAVLTMLLWSLCYPLIVIGLAEAPPLWFAGLRALIAGAALIAAGAVLRRPWPRSGIHWAALCSMGLLATTVGFGGMFLGGDGVSPGIATVISNAQPLFAALLARAAIGEPLKGARAWAIAVGFSGIATLSLPSIGTGSESVTMRGVGLVLLAALGVAAGNVLMKWLAGRTDAIVSMGGQLTIGALPLLGAALLFEPAGGVAWSGRFIGALSMLAIPTTAVATLLWFSLLERTELNRLNAFTFLTPVFGLGIGAALFGERLTATELLGAALVVLALILASRSGDPGTAGHHTIRNASQAESGTARRPDG